MDGRLVGWGRAVKSRQAQRRRRQQGGRQQGGREGGRGWPVLWLFTDAGRGGDVVRAVRGLPWGLCGVVFRHDGVAGRAALARAVWRACRAGRTAMVVAGAGCGFVGPGRHWRGGFGGHPGWGRLPMGAMRTASAHGRADLVRVGRGGLVFLSPVFPTVSHPGQGALGVVRWAGLARRRGAGVLALGGVTGATVRRLPRWVDGVGAIGALLPD